MKMTNFQLIFTGIFVLFIIAGVLAFSLYTANTNSIGRVVIWGSADQNLMDQLLSNLDQQDRSFQQVIYIQKAGSTYETDLINGMASGTGPDIALLSQDQIAEFSDKVLTIPYSVMSQSTYTSSYIFEGQIFLTKTGTLALPFLINPLVMYWNRDLFATAGIPQPPASWDEFLTEAQKLSVLDASNNIKRSAIALGSWDNVLYAKNILATFFMQAGDPIVAGYPGALISTFGLTPQNASANPAASALQFYTQFANPSKVTYSWNRSLPSSQDSFTAGDLAVYLGFATDYATLRSRNPNLNFGVSVLPQIKANSTHLTYGQLVGLTIPRTASNAQGALAIAEKLTSQIGATTAAQLFGLPNVRLDISQDTSANAVNSVFYKSALISRGWLDPSPTATAAIFSGMVDDVISNKSDPGQATLSASQSLQALIKPTSTQ